MRYRDNEISTTISACLDYLVLKDIFRYQPYTFTEGKKKLRCFDKVSTGFLGVVQFLAAAGTAPELDIQTKNVLLRSANI